MADIINLRLARKRKTRIEKTAKAAENRVRFGRTKAEKQRERLQEELDRARLDGAHVESEPTPDR